MDKQKTPIAVLVSGRGTNLDALLTACEEPKYPAEVVAVVSNNPHSQALAKAREKGVRTIIIDHKDFSSREEHEKAIVTALSEQNVRLIVLAGYMRILSKYIINQYPNAIINIHPALLPAFKGLNAQKQALEYGVKVTGATTHFVDTEMDHGPIIIQRSVAVLDHDTEDSLAQRILKVEHEILPESVALFCQDRLEVRGRKVVVRGV